MISQFVLRLSKHCPELILEESQTENLINIFNIQASHFDNLGVTNVFFIKLRSRLRVTWSKEINVR